MHQWILGIKWETASVSAQIREQVFAKTCFALGQTPAL